jgi:diaminopropionate ammonia-lyase
MAGYAVMALEILAARAAPPTHILIQGGCGGFAAAILALFWARFGAARPHVTVIEPARAACLLEAARAGRPVRVSGDLETLMGGLACGVVSRAAWPILRDGVDAYMILPESAIAPAMRDLARPRRGDPAIVAGETGAAGFAALHLISSQPELAEAIRLGPDSDVLIFVCEGATDPERYLALTAGG